MEPIESLAAELDKSVATLIVSQDDRTRRFIAETLLTAAALYLLKRYADKYLEGLGFDDMARTHGQRTREFLERLQKGRAEVQSVEELKEDLQAEWALGRGKPISNSAKEAAQEDVTQALIDAGAVRAQARTEATKVSKYAEVALLGTSP